MYICKTRAEFIKIFKSEYLPYTIEIEKKYGNGVDVCMRKEDWNNIIDSLCKDQQLPQRAMEWSAPW